MLRSVRHTEAPSDVAFGRCPSDQLSRFFRMGRMGRMDRREFLIRDRIGRCHGEGDRRPGMEALEAAVAGSDFLGSRSFGRHRATDPATVTMS